MTANLFDTRVMLVLLALALALAFGMVYANIAPTHERWFHPGTDEYALENDCGQNYTMKAVMTDWKGEPCEFVIGSASKEYVKKIQKQFEGEGDTGASTLEKALDYIERFIWNRP